MSIDLVWPGRRRFAAGIDVSPDAVRLAVVSRAGPAQAPVRVEWLGAVPLMPGIVSPERIADRAALAAALSTLRSAWPRRRSRHRLPCAMALPGSVTSIASIALSGKEHRCDDAFDVALDRLEAAAVAEAERVTGRTRHALVVDWFVDVDDGAGEVTGRVQECHASDGVAGQNAALGAEAGAQSGGRRLSVAAAERRHLEARIEAAAIAQLSVHVVDAEPPAALRALCHAAQRTHERGDRYAALWVGADGLYGWRVEGAVARARLHCRADALNGGPDALRELAASGPIDWSIVAGELGRLGAMPLALADIGDLVGAPVVPFACAPFCEGGAAPERWQHAPEFAVAFGLALRGVAQ
jgi:Tfp pilus assembly PilM family ATPase